MTDDVPESPNGTASTSDRRVKEAFPYLQGKLLTLHAHFVRKLRMLCLQRMPQALQRA